MRIDRLSKIAGLGNLPGDIYTAATKNVPLGTHWGPTIKDPGIQAVHDQTVRTQQGEMINQLAKVLGGSLLVGGGIGLARNLPKILHTRKALQTKDPRESEDTAVGELKAASAIGDTLSSLGSAAMSGIKNVGEATGLSDMHPIEGTVSGIKNMWNAAGESPKMNPYTGISESAAEAPVGSLPPGAAIPAYLATGAAGLAGGTVLAGMLTDSVRKKMLARRKREVQRQFAHMLSGKSAAAILLDKAAEHYEKEAAIGPMLTGAALTGALGLGALGYMGGRVLGKKYNPDYTKRQELEKALKAKVKGQPITFNIEPVEHKAEELEGPTPVSQLAGDTFNLPMIMPNRKKTLIDNHDEALDFGKLSELRKIAGPLDYLKNKIGGGIDWASERAAKGLAKGMASSTQGQELMGGMKDLRGSVGQVGQGINQISNTVTNTGKDIGALTKNLGETSDAARSTLHEFGTPMRWINDAARGVRDYMKPLSSMLMSGLQGIPQTIASGIHNLTTPTPTQTPPAAQPAAAPVPAAPAAQSAAPATPPVTPVTGQHAAPATPAPAAASAVPGTNKPVGEQVKLSPTPMPGVVGKK